MADLRTLTAAVVAVSTLVYGGLLSAYPILFASEKLFSLPPQLWRLVTPFLLTKPKLSIILDPYFRRSPILSAGKSHVADCRSVHLLELP
jgi:Derlin-2/3